MWDFLWGYIGERCSLCGCSSHSLVCYRCLSKFKQVPVPTCVKCGFPVENYMELCYRCKEFSPPYKIARSVYVYEGVVRKAIIKAKYRKNEDLSFFIASLLLEYLKRNSYLFCADVVVPVPSAMSVANDGKKNGLCSLLCNEVSKFMNIPRVDALKVQRGIKVQHFLPFRERWNNARNFIALDETKRLVKDVKVLLIDDIFTTGATCWWSCYRLLEGGVKEVMVLTFARALMKERETG